MPTSTHPPSSLDAAASLALAATLRQPDEEAALQALAILDPSAVAAQLAQADAIAARISRGSLVRLLEAVAGAIAQDPAIVPPEQICRLVESYAHLCSPETAGELVAALRPVAEEIALDALVRTALAKAPENHGLLRPAAELAAATGDHARAHELLTRLGRADGRLATARSVLAARSRLPRTDAPPIRIGLLSSFTIDPVVPYLDLECRGLRLEPHVHVAPFNTWEREMLGGGTALERFDPQIVFLATAGDDLVPHLGTGTAHQIAEAGEVAIDRLLASASRFASWSSGTLVVHALHTAFRDPDGPAAGRSGPSRGEILASLNARLAEGLRQIPRAFLLDVQEVLVRRGNGPSDNPKLRHMASMRIPENLLGDVARAYASFIAPLTGRTRKCIVLDLDNTLWGGVVGEEGPHGIQLGHTAPGSEYREFQQFLASLSRRGMLLAINSKNNEADALEVIRLHDAMVLREDAFAAMRINWTRKTDNMLSLAEELNLGLDSFVFIDDNEKERELMRQVLPQVLTPELPRDPARYRETLEGLPELQVLAVTDEDRARTRQYGERRRREQLRVASQTPEEYLHSLQIEVDIGPVTDRTVTRVHQLLQRTNQFNLTGRRYELGTLAARCAQEEWRIFTCQVRDRFGEHGLVAVALALAMPDMWSIENFVMSCRVIGYGIEDVLLAHMGTQAQRASARRLEGRFVATAKNAPARDFYARHGFARVPDVDAGERWCLDLSKSAPVAPAWIQARRVDGA